MFDLIAEIMLIFIDYIKTVSFSLIGMILIILVPNKLGSDRKMIEEKGVEIVAGSIIVPSIVVSSDLPNYLSLIGNSTLARVFLILIAIPSTYYITMKLYTGIVNLVIKELKANYNTNAFNKHNKVLREDNIKAKFEELVPYFNHYDEYMTSHKKMFLDGPTHGFVTFDIIIFLKKHFTVDFIQNNFIDNFFPLLGWCECEDHIYDINENTDFPYTGYDVLISFLRN